MFFYLEDSKVSKCAEGLTGVEVRGLWQLLGYNH